MATPEQCVLLVSPVDAVEKNVTQSPFLDQIDVSHLTPEELANLTSLLMDFSDVFSHESIPMGHTSDDVII